MQRRFFLTAGALVITFAVPSTTLAEQVTLSFRLVTQDVQNTSLDPLIDGGNSISLTKAVGTAVFEDGRIAHKVFSYSGENGAESGTFAGYSGYVFENGDRLNLRFVGGWSAEGLGGDYEVISGTGAYTGATGTGRFDGVGTDWEGATLFDGSFTLDIPES